MKDVDPFNVVVVCCTMLVICYFVCETIRVVYGVTP